MNALRRKATDDMAVSILGDYKRPNAGTPQITYRKAPVQDLPDFALTVRVDTIKGVEAAATSGADRVILGGETFNHIALTKMRGNGRGTLRNSTVYLFGRRHLAFCGTVASLWYEKNFLKL